MSRSVVSSVCAWLAAASLVSACVTQPAEESAVPSWDEFLTSSTRHFEGREIYVVDGDIPVSLKELRSEYERLFGGAPVLGVVSQPSTVNRVNGQDDVWSATMALNLKYCVSNEFGGTKGLSQNKCNHFTSRALACLLGESE